MSQDRTSFDVRTERLTLLASRSGISDVHRESTSESTSDNVDDWIKGVRALKEKRKAEDEARNRQLEADILKERKARQERRATRGRSISPSKQVAALESPNVQSEGLRRPRHTKSPEPDAPVAAIKSASTNDSKYKQESADTLAKSDIAERFRKIQLTSLPDSRSTELSQHETTNVAKFRASEDEKPQPSILSLSAESDVRRIDLEARDPKIDRVTDVMTTKHDGNPIGVKASATRDFGKSSPRSAQQSELFSSANHEVPTLSSMRLGLRSTNTVRAQIPDQVRANLLSAKSGLRSLEASPKGSLPLTGPIVRRSLVAAEPKSPLRGSQIVSKDSIVEVTGHTVAKPSENADVHSSAPNKFKANLAALLQKKSSKVVANHSNSELSHVYTDDVSLKTDRDKLRHLTKGRARRPRKQALNAEIEPNSESAVSVSAIDQPNATSPSQLSHGLDTKPSASANRQSNHPRGVDNTISMLNQSKLEHRNPEIVHRKRSSVESSTKLEEVKPVTILPSKPLDVSSGRISSPFSQFGRSSGPMSKSVSSMTGIADLIRKRADNTLAAQSPAVKVRVERRPTFTRAMSVTSAGVEELLPGPLRNVLYEDEVMLYKCEGENLWYQWTGARSTRKIKESVSFICGANARITNSLQGQETAKLLDMLKGSICTRYGSRNSPSQMTAELHRVRKYSTGTAVDQVPCRASSLCSGFAFILLSPGNHSILWEGRGSLASESEIAKQAIQELDPSSAIVVEQEGSESSWFWTALAGRAKYGKFFYTERAGH